MHSYFPYLVAAAGVAVAQSPTSTPTPTTVTKTAATTTMTVSMPHVHIDRPWTASIVKADKTVTEIDMKCGSAAATATATTTAPPCDFTNGIRISQGPSIWGYSMENSLSNEARTYFATCSFSTSKTMTCSGSIVTKLIQGSSTVTSTTTHANTITDGPAFPVAATVTATVTAGIEKLAATNAAANATKPITGGASSLAHYAVLAGLTAAAASLALI